MAIRKKGVKLAFSLPLLKKIHLKVKRFDQNILRLGVVKSSQRLLRSFNLTVDCPALPKLEKDRDYIIYGNHPFLLDPIIIILSLLEGKNIRLLAKANATKVSPNFTNLIFKVINSQTTNGKARSFGWAISFLFFKDYIKITDP